MYLSAINVFIFKVGVPRRFCSCRGGYTQITSKNAQGFGLKDLYCVIDFNNRAIIRG